MEYPGAKFTKPIRVAMLIFFFAAFFISTPTIILYSAGYRYDFKNGLLKETGSLSIDILPKNTTAYLEGLKLSGSMPLRLNNITPHKYTLQLTAPGYYDFQKQIEINRNQTTYIKEISLLKKTKPELLSKEVGEDMAVSDDGLYLAYTTKRKNSLVVVVENTESSLKKDVLNIPAKSMVKLEWSPNADFLTINASGSGLDKLYLVNAPSGGKLFDLSAGGTVTKYQWGNSSEPEIYYSTKNAISSYRPRLEQADKITDNIFQDWYMDNGSLWTLKTNTTTDSLEIVRNTLGFMTVFSNIPPEANGTSSLMGWKIKDFRNNTVLLKNNLEGTYLIVRSDGDFKVSGETAKISPFGDWYLFTSPFELWTYSLGDEPFLLNRPGVELKKVEPLDSHNTLALQFENEIIALYPYYFIERILVDKPVNSMAVNIQTHNIYYSDSLGIWRLGY